MWAGEAVGGGEEMLLQSLLGGISALTLGTPEVKDQKKKKKVFFFVKSQVKLLLLL